MPLVHRFVAIWWQAFRFHFVPPSFLPAILGAVIAWAATGKFYPGYFLLTVLGVTFNHIALNMTDDYFDFRHSVDIARNREKNPYSGGSGTLTNRLISLRQMLIAFSLFYFITIIIGFYLTVTRGWLVLVFGMFGMWCAYFYTAPPIRYGYFGFGELSQLINFSVTIGLGSFYVQAQSLSLEPILALLPLGFMMFSMITINEIPDEKTDRESGKRNLVVLFGAKTAVWLYGLGMFFAYVIILVSPIISLTSFWIYLSLVTFPWFIKALMVLRKFYLNAAQLSPANMLTIRIHNITGILLIVGYIFQGVQNFRRSGEIFLPLIVLILLYLPVALTVFFNILPLKPAERLIRQST